MGNFLTMCRSEPSLIARFLVGFGVVIVSQGCAPMMVSNIKSARCLANGKSSIAPNLGYNQHQVAGPYYDTSNGLLKESVQNTVGLPNIQAERRAGLAIDGLEYGLALSAMLHATIDFKYQFIGKGREEDFASAIGIEEDISPFSFTYEVGLYFSKRFGWMDFHVGGRFGRYQLFKDSNEAPQYPARPFSTSDPSSHDLMSENGIMSTSLVPSTLFTDILTAVDFYVGKSKQKIRIGGSVRFLSENSKTFKIAANSSPLRPEGYTFYYSPFFDISLSYFFSFGS